MRKLQVFLFLSLFACTPSPKGPQPVNVAAVRHDIQLVMPADRVVTSMGHTTLDSAVVYTTDPAGKTRREEHWQHHADGWKVEATTDLAATD